MPITNKCAQCGTLFTRPPSMAGRFCSRSCAGAARQLGLAERFWAKVPRGEPDACWLWQGARVKGGYGTLWDNARQSDIGAHRIAWEVTHGPIPDHLHVCHTCDVRYERGDTTYRYCVNPAHLFLGTTQDNTADSVAKQRRATGERHSSRTHPESIRRGEQHPARLHPERLARGERNGRRLHPERYPTGDLHHTRQHPERVPRGERQGSAKLTAAQVQAIRQRYRPYRVTLTMLAAEYGVDHASVGRVVQRKTWRHVP
jgi:hypothetical protein